MLPHPLLSIDLNRMRFLRHFGIFIRELWSFARQNKAWWILPVVGVLLVITLLIVTVTAASPFIYTLF